MLVFPVSRRLGLLAGIAVAVLLSLAAIAAAHEVKIGAIELHHPWVRATPAGAAVGGGYLEIRNTGTEPDRLVSVTVPFAERVELHEMAVVDGVMKMRPVAGGVEIPPGGTVALKPSSFHMMFIGLKEPLVEDQVVTGTLTFEKAGAAEVEFVVEPIGAKEPRMDDHEG